MKDLQIRIVDDITTEPVTVAEAKTFCHVTGSAEDSLFTLLITAARKAMEKYTNSTFAEKEIYATYLTLPEDHTIELSYGPIISVDKVYEIDDEGNEDLLTVNTDYHLFGDQDISVRLGVFWSTGIPVNRSVRIEYHAGYGDTVTEPLPDELKLAILKQVATDYLFRENIGGKDYAVLCNESKALAGPYRKKIWF